MPAQPPATPLLGLPRLAGDDHTRIWEHHNAVVDRIEGLLGAWVTYQPIWSQANGTILNVGSGQLQGRYKVLGKTVIGSIRLDRAADSNQGSQAWTWTLPPVSPRSWNLVSGSLAMVRGGAQYGGAIFPVTSGVIGAIAGDLGRVSNAIPSTNHAAGDWYVLGFTYEAA